jgi:hypothetical protein
VTDAPAADWPKRFLLAKNFIPPYDNRTFEQFLAVCSESSIEHRLFGIWLTIASEDDLMMLKMLLDIPQ